MTARRHPKRRCGILNAFQKRPWGNLCFSHGFPSRLESQPTQGESKGMAGGFPSADDADGAMEDMIEVGGVPFSMLDEDTPVEDLRAFHEAEALKCTLLKRMFPEEMYAVIAEVRFDLKCSRVVAPGVFFRRGRCVRAVKCLGKIQSVSTWILGIAAL